MSVKFSLSKKRKLSVPAADFASPDMPSEAQDTRSDLEKQEAARLLQQQGNGLAENGRFSQAIQRWDQALVLKPSSAALYELKAQAFMALDLHWQAVQSGDRATELDPDWPDGHLTLARAQREYGEPEMALVSLRKVLSLEPDHSEALAEIQEVQQLAIEERKNIAREQQQQQQSDQPQLQGQADDSG